MRTAGIGRVLFAATLIALGVMGIMSGSFIALWEPVPSWIPARREFAYGGALICLTCGLGLLWRRAAALAASTWLAVLLVWLLLVKVPAVVRAPAVVASWESCAETAVFVAGAWVLDAGCARAGRPEHRSVGAAERGIHIARALFGFALLAFGLAHFAYVKETAALVPGYLPRPVAWVYLAGGAYLAAGLAVLVGRQARMAATLAALQMGLFTALVWLPIVAKGSKDAFARSESVISWTLTICAWIVADSYRTLPRPAAHKR